MIKSAPNLRFSLRQVGARVKLKEHTDTRVIISGQKPNFNFCRWCMWSEFFEIVFRHYIASRTCFLKSAIRSRSTKRGLITRNIDYSHEFGTTTYTRVLSGRLTSSVKRMRPSSTTPSYVVTIKIFFSLYCSSCYRFHPLHFMNRLHDRPLNSCTQCKDRHWTNQACSLPP